MCRKWTHVKRPRATSTRVQHSVTQLADELARMRAKLDTAYDPELPANCADMSNAGSKIELIDWLWQGDFAECSTQILDSNPDMEILLQQRTKARTSGDAELHAIRRRPRLNFAAGVLARNRKKNVIPRDQVLLAIDAKHKMCNHQLWDMLSQKRVLPSINWTDDLVTLALDRNPGCPYPVMDWISAAVFDNYTTHRNYSASHNSDTQGERIDMTNWGSVSIPRAIAPHFRIASESAMQNPAQLIFKRGFNKYSVVDLCHPYHPDLVQNRTSRWCLSFHAIESGTFFKRPDFQPIVAHHIHYGQPMRGVLQSSYVDVEYELDTMRGDPRHRHCAVVFVGGDGLAINRINHTIARKSHVYLFSPPAVIPVQGEHPHGTDHVLHMGWRPYYPLLGGILNAIGHNECKSDFTVSDFNDYDHVSCILIEGITKYFLHLDNQGGGPPISNPTLVAGRCKQNIDLEWLFHYLHDYGFLYWDLRQAVRGNDSSAIDLIWRECVSFMHTEESHKTQYAPMAIMRIFWSNALSPNLKHIYDRMRTISLLGLPGSNVGWDMPIEKENLAISQHVVRPSFERIEKYVSELNFLGPVSRGIEKVFLANRNRKPGQMIKIQNDVTAVVNHLIKVLGGTWATACVPRAQKDSLLVNPPRSPRPWISISKAVNEGKFGPWVASHLDSKVTWPM